MTASISPIHPDRPDTTALMADLEARDPSDFIGCAVVILCHRPLAFHGILREVTDTEFVIETRIKTKQRILRSEVKTIGPVLFGGTGGN